MVLPFGTPDEAFAHHHVSVVLECGRRAVLYNYGPNAALTPFHRVFPVIQNQCEAFAPHCLVFDFEYYLHLSNEIPNPPPAAILRWRVLSASTICFSIT